MTDSVAEVRYQALRSKLNDLQYYQPLSTGSALLAERILVDIIKSVESFESLKKTADDQAKQLAETLEEMRVLKGENPRILEENNSLHLKIIQDGEEEEQEDARARLELRSLDDSIENAAFVLQREVTATAKLEREIDMIRDRIWESMPPEQRLAQPLPISKLELAKSTSVPSATTIATETVAKSVANELAKCVQDCKDLEIELDSRTRLLEATREQCSKLAAEVDAKGISVAALRNKAGLQRAQASVDKLNTEVDLLNYEHEGLKTQQQKLKAASVEVDKDLATYKDRVAFLQQKRDHWTDQVKQFEGANAQEKERMAKECAETSSRRDNIMQGSKSLEMVSRGTRAKIEALRQSFALERATMVQRVSEAQLQMQSMEKNKEQQQTLLSSEIAHADTRLKLLQQQKKQLEDNYMRVATEVSSQQMVLMRAREEVQAESSKGAVSSTFQGHAMFRMEEVTSQIAKIESFSDGLRRRAEALQSQLQNKKLLMQQAKADYENANLQSRNLEKVLQALTNTRTEMSEQLDHSLSGAQRAVMELEVANQRGTPLQSTNESLRQSRASCERNLVIVEDQQRNLQEEVRSWAAEHHQEKQRTEIIHAEVEQTHGEVQQVNAKLSLIESECRMQEKHFAEAEYDLNNELKTLAKTSDKVERERDEVCKEVYQEVQKFEHSMGTVQTEIVELTQQKDYLISSRARASGSKTNIEEELQKLAAQVAKAQKHVEESDVESSHLKIECSKAVDARESLSERTSGLLEDLSELCERVRRTGIHDQVLKQAMEEKRLQYSEAKACKTTYSQGMQASKHALDEASVECNSLQEEVKQLSSMISGLEAVKGQITEQIQQHEHEVTQEQKSRNRVLESASACSEKRGAVQFEVEALQRKLVEVDEQRDELQTVADDCAEDISSMKTESEALQDAMAEMQKAIQSLQQTVVVQKDQIKERDRMLMSNREMEQQVKLGIAAVLEKPFTIGPGDTNAILQDLSNMTRENQLLHEELRVMKQKTDNIQGDIEEQLQEQQSVLRGLGAIRLEKDDVVHRYQSLQEQNQRRSAASSQITLQQLHMQENIKELTAQLEQGIANEKEWRHLKLQTETDLAAVREQLRGLADRLQSTESAREAAEAVSSQLRHNAACAQRTAHDAEVKWEKQEHHAAALAARYQHVEAETRRTFAEVAEARRAIELGTQRQRALEELLLEQQLRSREVERENIALRRRLTIMDSETQQPSIVHQQDLPALRQQLEEQYLLLGDQDATQLQAAAEVRGLRQELQSLQSQSG
eukprot:gnl/MRDRNA2_/MRDRNA2_97651_c0_seq1.p1 gnl/MRDRNA2_/MRDRNA2_97651_c0~~gnl/MRDRNA2_/MRDRNA2_97651_c0_seq1.p1  ORF type:complete len:1275 (+),score=371.54 gnl/MRDRNA2_/MRDRNA2_97651_c0_seq1:82-3906(+)